MKNDNKLSPAEFALREAARECHRSTMRGNLVGVITNGTAVLDPSDIGPLAGKSVVMDGTGCLFKKFAGIDLFDIIVTVAGMPSGTLGANNLIRISTV